MRKIFSIFLLVCVVLTSLSVSVSASYTAPTTDANYNTFTFDGTGDKRFNVGDWYLSNGTNPAVKLGNITDNTVNMGMKFKKIVFNGDSLSGATASTLSIRGEINQTSQYLENYAQGSCGTEYITVANMNTYIGAVDGISNSGGVVKYTMYAYSALPDGEPISFNIVRQQTDYGAVLTVPASKLYSENGIPHKIDFIIYHTSTLPAPMSTKSNSAQRMEVWIDGMHYDEGCVAVTAISNTGRFVFLSPNINLTPDASGVVTWKNSELYICSSPSGLSKYKGVTTDGEYVTVHTRDELQTHLFQQIHYGGTAGGVVAKDFITGVDSALVADIEGVYTTELSSGDRVLEVDKSFYNNPASIWNADTSSVSLVKTEDGTVYGVADKDSVTGTFADYYIAVNGVYTKVVEKQSVTDYNIASKTATVNVSNLPEDTESLQIIVAAYNANGAMEKISVSESKTDFSLDSITHTVVDSTFPTDAYKYKVFVFDSLTSAKPLIEALEK